MRFGKNLKNKMIAKSQYSRGIIAKFLEQAIKILLIKQCKKISKIKINIISSTTQIIKGEIQKITIIAEDINYKDLLFDEFELEADQLKFHFELTSKEFCFKNNSLIKYRIALSEDSLRKIFLSNNWNWIKDMISKEILNQDKLEDIEIKNDKFIIKTSKKNKIVNYLEKIDLKAEKGKIYLENKSRNNSLKIPVEEKIYIEDVNIENNLINIFANSPISLKSFQEEINGDSKITI
tara:strand:+ start:172 stop:879 length:708 start_codon:yes stop_codon:yes gene_type:complete